MDTSIAAFRPFHIQVISLVCGTFVQFSWGIVILRWQIYFVPPALNGASMGLTFAIAGAAQIAIVGAIEAPVATLLGAQHDLHDQLLFPVLLWGGLALILGVASVASIAGKNSVPAEPPTMDDVLGVRVRGQSGKLRMLSSEQPSLN